jgi:hypothetical protein
MTEPFAPVPPDLMAAISAAQAAQAAQDVATRAQLDARRQVLAYAWLLCSCRPWFDAAQRDVPPQAGCIVHGSVMVTLEGDIL